MKIQGKVLLTQPIHEVGLKIIEDSVEEVIIAPDDRIDTLRSLVDERLIGVVVRYNPFPRELIEKAANLKVISRHGIGIELIDIEAATEYGVIVTNTPNAATVSVAEHVIMMAMALSKKVFLADAELRKGNYAIKDRYLPQDLDGSVMGLIGLGRIGLEVARRCRCLGMEVIAYDPYIPKEKAAKWGVQLKDTMEEVLVHGDFISLHTPLNDSTYHLMDENQLAMMKPSAYLINCSRGEVINEEALIHAIEGKKIAGAGLDVFEKEPPSKDNKLFSCDNVIVTPHSSSLTIDGKIKMAKYAAQQLIMVLRGEEPEYIVNPMVFKK